MYHPAAVCHSSDEDTDVDTTEWELSSATSSPLKMIGKSVMNPTTTAYYTQLMLRNSIQDHPYDMPWPLTSSFINLESFEDAVPDEILQFVSSLLQSRAGMPLVHSDKVRVSSICQDLLMLVSTGKLNSPKAMALGLVVKHLTGSRELIDILHRLGHSVSYDTLRSYETSLAVHALSNRDKVPDKFEHGQPIVMVWDNIDFLEATRSGHNTTHHTNGILLQIQVQAPQQRGSAETRPRGNQRSLDPVSDTITHLPTHIRTNPKHLNGFLMPQSQRELGSDVLEFSFALVRRQEEFPKPSWTGFNKMARKGKSSPKTKILYLPVIEAAPTDIDVVNHIMQRSLEEADKFGLNQTVVVFDQAIYSKAQTIRFLNPIMMARIVPRLGEFHTVMTFLGVIGKRFGGAGMTTIITESQCVAEGSMKGVVNGHSYNRSIMAHKLLAESMYDLLLDQYVSSLDSDSHIESLSLDTARAVFAGETDISSAAAQENVYRSFRSFVDVASQGNPTFRFWSQYIEMVTCLLSFIRATRESDWSAHIVSFRRLLPWFFAYDHANYARYGTLYYAEMTKLEETHTEVFEALTERGYFTFQSRHHSPFSSIACDQAIEQTVNRDSKSQGGLIGFTRKSSASQRWTLSHPERTAVHTEMKKLLVFDNTDAESYEMREKAWKADEDMRETMKEIITARINPFSFQTSKLVHITSGAEASDEVQRDLETANTIGENQLSEFVQKRISAEEVDFNASIKSNKLKTFTALPTAKRKSKEKVLECSHRLFDRLLVISQQRNLDLRKVLTFSLGNISWSLANSDGSILKTAKSALMAAVEKDVDDQPSVYVKQDQLPAFDAVVIDAMAEIQTLKTPPTFGMVASQLLKRIGSIASVYRTCHVDFVCDTYPDVSIKGGERSRRSMKGSQKVAVFGPNQSVPKWSEFLADGSNKTALVKFLKETWSTSKVEQKLDLIITFSNECHKISYNLDGSVVVGQVESLSSDHEEADTRMLSHIANIMDGKPSSKVLIKCQDTDVFLICLSLVDELPSQELIYCCGKRERLRYVNMGNLSTILTPEHCKALLGLHALSGCDSVSAFYSKGKKTFFKLLKNNPEYCAPLKSLGEAFEVDVSTRRSIETFICRLYGEETNSINEARYKIFCSPSRTSQSNLPPTQDELDLHISRACYQTAIWRRAKETTINAPLPQGHGWHMEKGELKVKWMNQQPAPADVLMDMFCRCKTGCQSRRCQCIKADLKCTDMCRCSGCSNRKTEGGVDSSDTDSDDCRIEGWYCDTNVYCKFVWNVSFCMKKFVDNLINYLVLDSTITLVDDNMHVYVLYVCYDEIWYTICTPHVNNYNTIITRRASVCILKHIFAFTLQICNSTVKM